VNTPDHCAKRTIELANAAGVRFTSAGATYPLGLDPRDRNIRVAPSLPSLPDIQKAMDVFCTCVKLAALEKVHH
jgi:DNA-binding transcriptional MocR family regulator